MVRAKLQPGVGGPTRLHLPALTPWSRAALQLCLGVILGMGPGCADPPAAPLPAPALAAPVLVQAVQHGAVFGVLVRRQGTPIEGTGLLLRVPTVRPPPTPALTDALAGHALVFAVPPEVELAAAETYLAGIPGIHSTTRACAPAPCAP